MARSDLDNQIAKVGDLGLTLLVAEAIRRGLMRIDGQNIVYHLRKQKTYRITDPEEKVRADTIAFLVLIKGYDSQRIETEVAGSHGDVADVVLYRDDRCTDPYLVIENKKAGATKAERLEGEGQAFANAIALKASYAMKDYGDESYIWKVEGFGGRERERNRIGDRDKLAVNYSKEVAYRYVAGGESDIAPADTEDINLAIRYAHSVIWAGGKRDPLSAFDEWSKLMFAKVRDERYTESGKPRKFQIGVDEPDAAVASRVYELYRDAKEQDLGIFPNDEPIELPDSKIASVVKALQHIAFMETDSDVIGTAFENFFGSVFRGNLGQYFTMRPIARFAVDLVRPTSGDYVLDPTCGSGGFLLETLLQVWRDVDGAYAGQANLERIKSDFALQNVYGVEIHPVLARICKISLLLHHDGHTNIEADKSFLSPHLETGRLSRQAAFDVIVGNPPFGTKIEEGDEDQLDGSSLKDFEVSKGRSSVPSEQVILEKSVLLLKPGGRLAMVLPDGLLNDTSANCPVVRKWLFAHGRIAGVISLPDFAFRRSGATNKTSILVFEKFTEAESHRMAQAMAQEGDDIGRALERSGLDYQIFFAEADYIGYTPTGMHDERNDLYNADEKGLIAGDQAGSILGEWHTLHEGGEVDDSRCVVSPASAVLERHSTHRIDPKFHVYMAHERDHVPAGWTARPIGEIARRRKEMPDFSGDPMREYTVLTISKTGELRQRAAGGGYNPQSWIGLYFQNSSSRWYRVHEGDVVYSGIDLWKGAVSYVPKEFDGALVTSEYPILQVIDDEVDAEYLAVLMRSAMCRKAFRAINTGHSNRKRVLESEVSKVLVCYPQIEEQREIAAEVRRARVRIMQAYDGIGEIEARLDRLLSMEAAEEFDEELME